MDRIHFKINGKLNSVGCETRSDVMLLDYLRSRRELRGTKYMCREGGCGACVVAAARPGEPAHAVNSCLVSVTSCEGWEVSTIEGIGNRLQGYHPLQKTLAKFNGTQCGYCSPGWVMAMYSLLQTKKDLTMLDVEKSFGSNICRCTGYRPILDAFKKFASDSPKPNNLLDIEDLNICEKSGQKCFNNNCDVSEWCFVEVGEIKSPEVIKIELNDGKLFFKVYAINDVFKILLTEGNDDYMLIAGNTAKGVYYIDEYPRILIDITSITQLKGYQMDQNLIVGAGSTLTETIDIFKALMQRDIYFKYLEALVQHLDMVAHIPVRNIGTIAGNLMIKHQHNDFQSDIFVLLETVGAMITIVDYTGVQERVTLEYFLEINMRGKIILNVLLPPLCPDEYRISTFKIMPRSQNAHAIVNAGFLYKVCGPDNTVAEARLVYGGLSPSFVHAAATERFLVEKKLFTNETVQGAINILNAELIVSADPPEPSVEYRRALAIALFYKGLLSRCPESILSARYRSGGIVLSRERPVSTARQVFDTNPDLWPLNQPVEKVEALIQCAGEAIYTEDLATLPREVFGAFVLSTVASADIASIDTSIASKQPGFIEFYSAKDIPGVNSFVPDGVSEETHTEELFCDGKVKYYSQVIGVIVAETRQTAERAAKLVKVEYVNVKTPLVDILEAKNVKDKTSLFIKIDATDRGTDICKVIKGGDTFFGQYHMCMETLVTVARPTEEGIEVYASTQWTNGVQIAISRALKMPENKIDVHVRRLGGAFGIKISRASQVAVACSLVTAKLNRPCRILLPLVTNTKAIGKRPPCSTNYEVAVDKSGKIQYIDDYLYTDNGYVINEKMIADGNDLYYNCYGKSRWSYTVFNVITNTASNTYCRAPGTLETISMAENVMERIAYEINLDPLEVRLANLDSESDDLRGMIDTVKENAQYSERRAAVDKFNRENRWKKRGLRFSLLHWKPLANKYFDVNMSVYLDDGSVAITHSGIEMGQGINTKAVQICAYLLKIPVEKVEIKTNNTIFAPNGSPTGGSVTSLNVGIGVRRCCEELLRRLEPVRRKLSNPTWEDLIRQAFDDDIDLQTHGFTNSADFENTPIFGITLAEVEVDILTGEWELLRVDVLEDAGMSVSPFIDVGQVEGAFIMGLGYWTSERLSYAPSGELLTDRTWNYHVPLARDIPQDFRVYLRKNSYSDKRIFGAKAIGEPPICMSVAVPFAIREAITAARLDAGIPSNQWFQINGPYTREAIQLSAASDYKEYKFY